MPPPTDYKVGMRLRVGSDRCTIRWVGKLDGDKFDRLGLEWDQVSRGRHTGEFNGRTYFKPMFPNSASFIKKPPFGDVTGRVEAGIGLIQALEERYLESEGLGDEVVPLESSPSVKIETVGWSKVQAKLADPTRLKMASACDTNVSWIDSGVEVSARFPNLEELDLSRTLVSGWEELFELVASHPKLHTLRLDENRFQNFTGGLSRPLDWVGHLTTLSLNETYISFEALTLVSPQLQQLRTLHLRGNGYRAIPLPPCGKPWFPNLVSLNLSQNRINGANSLDGLQHLPSLEHLDLSQNSIQTLPVSDATPLSRSLQRLNLNHNELSGWEPFDHLNGLFPRLSHLQALENPVIEENGASISRTMLISLLPGLTALNLSPISPRERVDAELYYLSRLAPKTRHSQLTRLSELYGQAQVPTKPPGGDSARVRDRLFLLKIFLCENPPTADSVYKNWAPLQTSQKLFLSKSASESGLPPLQGTATVRTLQLALPKLIRLPPGADYQLYAVLSPETSGSPGEVSTVSCIRSAKVFTAKFNQVVLLDNPVRSLQAFYCLKEGDAVCVVPV